MMRILHTMLRVRDLERSIEFYTTLLGMDVQRRSDYAEGRFTLVFLGYSSAEQGAQLELTYNWDTHDYQMGNAFGHVAIAVEDVYEACARIKAQGGEVVRDAGPMKHGTTVLAFVKDPDGYLIELLAEKTAS